MRVTDRTRAESAFALVYVPGAGPATARHQRCVPSFDVEGTKPLQGAGAEIGDDVELNEFIVALRGRAVDDLGELPVCEAGAQMLGDRELCWIYVIAFAGLSEKLC